MKKPAAIPAGSLNSAPTSALAEQNCPNLDCGNNRINIGNPQAPAKAPWKEVIRMVDKHNQK